MREGGRPIMRVRYVRCPDCRKVYQVPWNTPADRGSSVRFWDWPRRLCDECREQREYDAAVEERQKRIGGDRQREPGIDPPEILGE